MAYGKDDARRKHHLFAVLIVGSGGLWSICLTLACLLITTGERSYGTILAAVADLAISLTITALLVARYTGRRPIRPWPIRILNVVNRPVIQPGGFPCATRSAERSETYKVGDP